MAMKIFFRQQNKVITLSLQLVVLFLIGNYCKLKNSKLIIQNRDLDYRVIFSVKILK